MDKQKKTTKPPKPAKAKKAKRSPKQLRQLRALNKSPTSLKLRGAFMGYLNSTAITKAQKAKAKELRAARGTAVAIGFLKKIKDAATRGARKALKAAA